MEISRLLQLCVLLCSAILPATLAYTRDDLMSISPPFPYNPNNFNYPPSPYPYGLDSGKDIFSCKDRCDIGGLVGQQPCQCNKKCMDYGDCCLDYGEECLSCEGRCDFTFNRNFPCQCNDKCNKFNNCCEDHATICMRQPIDSTSSHNVYNNHSFPSNMDKGVVTDAQLATLAEELLALDQTNNAASLIRISPQNRTFFSDTEDRANNSLLTVEPAAYQKPSIAKLLLLHNNYVAGVNAQEIVTAQESAEETQFLDTILPTPIMRKAEQFLVNHGFIIVQRRTAEGRIRMNNRAFRDALNQIWFGMYSRSQGPLGSSGFEHIFLGETKAGQVSGFHNWVFFSKEEANNNLNYSGHLKILRLGPKASIIKHKFRWIGNVKPVSTMFIGTSPEFEMALYTVCFYARPNAKCPVTLYGKHINIQTHTMNRQGAKLVGSAYADI